MQLCLSGWVFIFEKQKLYDKLRFAALPQNV